MRYTFNKLTSCVSPYILLLYVVTQHITVLFKSSMNKMRTKIFWSFTMTYILSSKRVEEYCSSRSDYLNSFLCPIS